MNSKFSIITLVLILLTSSCTSNNNKKNEQENLSAYNEIAIYDNPEIQKLNNLIESLKQRLAEDTKKDSIPDHIDIVSFLNICCSDYINPPIILSNRNNTDVINSYINILKPAATKDILRYGHFKLYINEERLTQYSQEIYDTIWEPELTKIIFRIGRAVQKRKSYKNEIFELNALFLDAIGHDLDPEAGVSELNDAFDRIRKRKPEFLKKYTRKQLNSYLDGSPSFFNIVFD